MPVPIWAGRYIGLPFLDHGRDRAGLDCWGLVRLVFSEQFNIGLPAFIGEYNTTADIHAIAALVEREALLWREVAPSDEKRGEAGPQ